MPLDACLQATGGRQFLIWCHYLQREEERRWLEPTPDQWYLAQIAAAIKQLFAKRLIRVESLLVKFKLGGKKPKGESPEFRMMKSQMFWGAVLESTATRQPPKRKELPDGRADADGSAAGGQRE
jgi:ribosomal protein S19E (S16A)